MRRKFLTPPALTDPPPAGSERTIHVADEWRAGLISGALLLLCDSNNWQQSDGGMTEDATADYFTDLFFDFLQSDAPL